MKIKIIESDKKYEYEPEHIVELNGLTGLRIDSTNGFVTLCKLWSSELSFDEIESFVKLFKTKMKLGTDDIIICTDSTNNMTEIE